MIYILLMKSFIYNDCVLFKKENRSNIMLKYQQKGFTTMPRHIVLGNQQLLVNIDRWLQVRDIFYPHVGQYNHVLGHAHKVAILEGDDISWLNEDAWEKDLSYLNETLVTNCKAAHQAKRLTLYFKDNVYCEDNIFFRKITIKNNAEHKRKVRICFTHDFHLYGDGIGDTALWHPTHEAVIHYKRSSYFLIGITSTKKGSLISDYNIAEHVSPSQNLPKNPIAQGSVDSIIAVDVTLKPGQDKCICYYLCAGDSFDDVFNLQKKFLKKGMKVHLSHSEMCQRGWVSQNNHDVSMLPQKVQDIYKRSLLVIKTQIDKNGAIIAANDSDNMQYNKDTYSYVWPRDGALVAIPLIKAGFYSLVKPFFEFCNDVLYEEGCLLHKYNPDKTLGSSWHPWVFQDHYSLPIQEDETALVLHALWVYYEHTHDKKFIKELYTSMIKPMAHFLNRHRYKNGLPKESYDLWEERRATFTFTTATVVAGLHAAEKFAHIFRDQKLIEHCVDNIILMKKAMVEHLYKKDPGYFRRGVSFEHGKEFYDDTMDASAYAVSELDIFPVDDPMIVSTMKNMKDWLWIKTPVGGIARYHNDYYHQISKDIDAVPGNPWFICTLWYAKYIIRKATRKSQLKEALKIINWVVDHTLSTGLLAEQLHPHSGEPLSVSPLTWSHAEFVDTVCDYVEKLNEL